MGWDSKQLGGLASGNVVWRVLNPMIRLVCLPVCLCVCPCLWLCLSVSVCLCVSVCVCESVCLCVFVSLCMCVPVCMSVSVCVCMCVYVCAFIELVPSGHVRTADISTHNVVCPGVVRPSVGLVRPGLGRMTCLGIVRLMELSE
jgi:hypothetical protein